MNSVHEVLENLDLGQAMSADAFHMQVGHIGLTVHCPEPLRSELMEYFDGNLSQQPGQITVHLLPGQQLDQPVAWIDWQREPGKAGRKDAILDLDDGRLIKKLRSGVTFLQARDWAIAFGPLTQNVSTVINFINTQILSACLREGWQLCHAAGATRQGRTLAISGLSGGGKSTSILRMMDMDGMQFLSNDRILVHPGNPARALGIPKYPRINPGTILGNPRLHGLLSAGRRAELSHMPPDELWQLEEKHDLIVPDIYGPDRICLAAPLTDFWVLNWGHDQQGDTRILPVSLDGRPDLLAAMMKSAGPFHQYRNGHFEANGVEPDPMPYLQALRHVRVREVSGRIDFDKLADEGRRLFDG
ncbi:HprK-related kinase B [Paracoccus sp. Z330]|uniref:HprK-related kinase B n=1 Tax=Paracoccus onchidii TaxID=3017813 RepID=A0ABT4Z9H8_9RHOB|nr:HprK-related kinase B [Paracoccus onchidii]MDB6175994.1 HprK-related kinase B [Paracoccus onchidii]